MDKAKKVVRRERKGFRGANPATRSKVKPFLIDLLHELSRVRNEYHLKWNTSASYLLVLEQYEKFGNTTTAYFVMKHIELTHDSKTLRSVQSRMQHLVDIGLLSFYMVKLTKHYYPSTAVLSQTA